MFRQWLTLVIIVLVYIPVAIDATVLHVAAPTLSMTLGASGNELLWIIDIYSLVMAGMVLPMGALGDRIGFKRLLMLGGTLFGLASLAAAFSHTASWLIATRVLLAIGAAMIVPATLAGIRATFCEEKHRNMALGVWGSGRFGRSGVWAAHRRHLIRAFLLGIGFPDQRADCAGRHGLNRPLCSSPGGPSRSTAQSWPCGDADYCHFAVGL